MVTVGVMTPAGDALSVRAAGAVAVRVIPGAGNAKVVAAGVFAGVCSSLDWLHEVTSTKTMMNRTRSPPGEHRMPWQHVVDCTPFSVGLMDLIVHAHALETTRARAHCK